MKLIGLYRGLLLLYPGSFRRQFSEEMISVFRQRAAERPLAFNFLISEFSGIAKGACIMWLAKILNNRKPSPTEAVGATCTPVTIAELSSQRQTVIRKMVASIAAHDFLEARRYSNEETRLTLAIRDLENETPAPGNSSIIHGHKTLI